MGGDGTDYLNQNVSWLVSTLMGIFMPLLVMTGMQGSIIPIIVQSYVTFAGITALLGITELAMFGVTLKLRKLRCSVFAFPKSSEILREGCW